MSAKLGVIAVTLVALLSGCEAAETGDDSVNGMVAFLENNPPVSDELWREVSTLECRPNAGRICSAEGCKDIKPVTFIRWTPASARYERCGGSSPCDPYTVQLSHSGSYTNLVVPERGMMARVTAGGEFVEVLTQMSAVYVYHGQCQRMP